MTHISKRKYQTGKQAREAFERTMVALFRAPKPAIKPKPAKQERKD
jgi:hypothetical protein